MSLSRWTMTSLSDDEVAELSSLQQDEDTGRAVRIDAGFDGSSRLS